MWRSFVILVLTVAFFLTIGMMADKQASKPKIDLHSVYKIHLDGCQSVSANQLHCKDVTVWYNAITVKPDEQVALPKSVIE